MIFVGTPVLIIAQILLHERTSRPPSVQMSGSRKFTIQLRNISSPAEESSLAEESNRLLALRSL